MLRRYPHHFLISLALVTGVLIVFLQTANHSFVGYDDDVYVTDNHWVRAGLTRQGVSWAFTTFHAANWHPLTWLSHMADTEFFGLDAGKHHLVSVAFHLANTLLLFASLLRMTGCPLRSGFVAALFAVHPLHVESVAWVAERKDVLSTFLFFWTVWAYIRYAERPGRKRYALVAGFFALGLLSKPMIVTLPFVLLLLDAWPLGRVAGLSNSAVPQRFSPAPVSRVVWEKVPLLAMSAASCLMTVIAQEKGGALSSLDIHPFGIRVANATVGYAVYLGKTLWPISLAAFYPFDVNGLGWWEVLGSALLLSFLTFGVIRLGKRLPCLPVGWFWYLGTLVPVLGLVQVGIQSTADRYTYLPLIGIFLMIAWGVPEALMKWRIRRQVLAGAVGVVLPCLIFAAWIQTGYWRNTLTLFQHALDVTRSNLIAHVNMGYALEKSGMLSDAVTHYRDALQINRNFPPALNGMGNILAAQGKIEMAAALYREAAQRDPNYAMAFYNLGVTLTQMGEIDRAMRSLREAIRIRPGYSEAHTNFGALLHRQGKFDEAFAEYSQALRYNPDDANAHYNIGLLFARAGKYTEAGAHFREVLRIRPGDANASRQLQSLEFIPQ